MKKVHVKTQGCQMNEYDSEKILSVLRQSHRLIPTDFAEEADVLLLNTCSIRDKAQEKVFSQLGRWNKLKQKKPDLVIGVGGCVASQEGENLRRRAPFVSLVFGPQTLHRLPAMLHQHLRNGKPVTDISFPEIEKFDHLPKHPVTKCTASVSIMEGCSKYCSFCVVPYTRGTEFSRPLHSILEEIEHLTAHGVKEVTLLGQNVNAYRYEYSEGTVDFALLLYHVAAIRGVNRIRYTSSHPLEFNDNLIRAYADIPQLVEHLHLPVQSGSDRILSLMKRGYTVLEYKAKLRQLRDVRPEISISSDFIVGFPGETEEDFQMTLDLVNAVGFDQSFSFIYSPRPGTPAASLSDTTNGAEKKRRLHRLNHLLDRHTAEISERMVGSMQPVLVEGVSRKNKNELCGRSGNNRVVNFPGEADLTGKFVTIRIDRACAHSLHGTLV